MPPKVKTKNLRKCCFNDTLTAYEIHNLSTTEIHPKQSLETDKIS